MEKAEKYSLKPVAMAIFGGWFSLDKMGWMGRKVTRMFTPDLVAAGVKEVDGTYDTRDFNRIREWIKEVARKIHS